MNIDEINFGKEGLVAAIVQDAQTRRVLTLAYMNKESLQRTLETGETWIWSRSRQQLWHKGETSGHTQRVEKISLDCDADALLVVIEICDICGLFSIAITLPQQSCVLRLTNH